MLDEVDPDSDPDELRIELVAAGLNAIAAMGGGTKENFMEMAKKAAQTLCTCRKFFARHLGSLNH
jgi:hypothetical protein